MKIVEDLGLHGQAGQAASVPALQKLTGMALLVFAGFFILFAVLRTQEIFAIDGGNRCFEIYRRPVLYFDVNNHLLQPAHVLAWTRLAAAVGYTPKEPIEFFHLVSLMNCLAMAASLAILFALMYVTVPQWKLALGVTIGYGFSKSFLLQATNANEPPMGLLWSFLALLFAVLCFRFKSIWPAIVSAALLAIAMATYQTMILLFPAALYLLWQSRAAEVGDVGEAPRARTAGLVSPAQTKALVTYAVSGAATTAIIFGYAYSSMGVHGVVPMLRRFLLHEDTRVYMGVNGGKLLNVPVGFVRNVFPVAASYTGLRALVHGHRGVLILFLAVGALAGACLAVWVNSIRRNRNAFSAKERIGLWAAVIGLAVTAVPLIIWDPQYPKFWLQPLACVAFLVMLALHNPPEEGMPYRRSAVVIEALFLIGILSNSAWAIRDHLGENPDLRQAQEIARIVGPDDFVVGSWYGAAILYGAIYAGENRFLDFPEDAAFHHEQVTSELSEAVAATAKRGGRVYFIGVLDQDVEEWNKFLGDRCGIPYSTLGVYREHSTFVRDFGSGASKVTMWRFDPQSVNRDLRL